MKSVLHTVFPLFCLWNFSFSTHSTLSQTRAYCWWPLLMVFYTWMALQVFLGWGSASYQPLHYWTPKRHLYLPCGPHTVFFCWVGIPPYNSEATGQPHTTHLSTALWAPYGHQDPLPHPLRPIDGVEAPSFLPKHTSYSWNFKCRVLMLMGSLWLSPQSWDSRRSPMQPPELPHCATSCTGRKPGLREVK